MPELPEVETIRYDLHKVFSGYQIKDISGNTEKMTQPSLKEVKKQIIGLIVQNFRRRAKLLIVDLNKNFILANIAICSLLKFWSISAYIIP